MIDINKSSNEYFLTQSQFDSRKQAGTLEVGAVYHITDESGGGSGTKVTVNGVEQTTWNADTKLDKSTLHTTYNQLYGKTKYGQNGFYDLHTDVLASVVPQRDGAGQIKVPSTPTAGSHAASKAYVDNAVASGTKLYRHKLEDMMGIKCNVITNDPNPYSPSNVYEIWLDYVSVGDNKVLSIMGTYYGDMPIIALTYEYLSEDIVHCVYYENNQLHTVRLSFLTDTVTEL